MQYRDEKEKERYKKLFYNFYYQTSEITGLMEYLAGQQKTLPKYMSHMNSFYNSYVRHKLEGYPFEEEYETDVELKRLTHKLIQILYEHAPNLLMKFLSTCTKRYYYYKEAGLPEEFLLQDAIFMSRNLEWDGKDKAIISCFSGLDSYAPTLLETIRNATNETEQKIQFLSYLLAAYEKEIPKLEEKIFSKIYKYFASKKDLINWDLEDISMQIQIKTIVMCESFMTEKMKQYAGLIFAICPKFIYGRFSSDEFYILCDKINAPIEVKLRYKIIGRRNYYSKEYYEEIEQELSLFTQENKRHIDAMMQRLLENQDSTVLYAYGICRKKGLLTKEEEENLLPLLRELLLSKLKKFYQERLKTEKEYFQFIDCEKGDFRSFSKVSPKQRKIFVEESIVKRDWYVFEREIQPLVNACGILGKELLEAANIITLFITACSRYQTQLCSLPKVASYYRKEVTNPFELFYEASIPFDVICKIGLADLGAGRPEEYNFDTYLIQFIQNHRQEAEEQLEDMIKGEDAICYIRILYKEVKGAREECLVPLLKGKQKGIVKYAEELLQTRQTEKARKEVEAIIAAGKPKATVDIAIRLIRKWDKEKMEKELQVLTTEEELISYIESKYEKNNEKNVPYAKEIDYGQVHFGHAHFKASKQLAPNIVLKFYISEYINLEELQPIKFCEELAKWLNPYDLLELLWQIYKKWVLDGAAPKFKNILLPYALHCGPAKLEELKGQIGEWAENKKPALAVLATKCIALNGSKEALLLVDTMSKKHKNKRVKRGALEALEFARKELGISKEEMEDRMVPDLGFQNRKRIFSYGRRSFEARLFPDLSIVLYDGEKEIKSLPNASEKFGEQEQKVQEVKEELKAVKKQAKLIVEAQKARMEKAIYSGRKWTKERWLTLFSENPFLFGFATGLIWEELNENGDILGTFRYMEDGSLNTKEEEEYKLSKNTWIRLLYPSDITEEEVEEWKKQLEDYEIIQPISQLSLPVLRIKGEDGEKEVLCSIQGHQVYGSTIKSIATKMSCQLSYTDWECDGFYRSFSNENLIMTLDCDLFDTGNYTAVVRLKKIQFLRNGSRETPLKLIEVPGRVLGFAKGIEDMLLTKEIRNDAIQR